MEGMSSLGLIDWLYGPFKKKKLIFHDSLLSEWFNVFDIAWLDLSLVLAFFFFMFSFALIQCCNLLSWKCRSLPLQFCTYCKLVQLTLESLWRLTKLTSWRVFSMFFLRLDFVASMAHLSIQIIATRFSFSSFQFYWFLFFMLYLSSKF